MASIPYMENTHIALLLRLFVTKHIPNAPPSKFTEVRQLIRFGYSVLLLERCKRFAEVLTTVCEISMDDI